MSTDSKGLNETPDMSANGGDQDAANQTADGGQQQTQKDMVAYETYRKTLSLAKKREAELDAERAEKQKLLEEKMAAEGKKDELIESWKKRYQELEGKTKKVVGSFSYKTLAGAISEVASKEGCVDSGDLIALGDVSAIEVDDDFNVNMEQVKEFVLSMKKQKPHLFSGGKVAPKVGSAPAVGDIKTGESWKKLDPLKQAELAMNKLLKQ